MPFAQPYLGLFGTQKQTTVLILLHLLEESYARELARVTGISLPSVQNLIEKLELQGVLATRVIGKERRVQFNPRFFAHSELGTLLRRLADASPAVEQMAASLRRRPRRKGKLL